MSPTFLGSSESGRFPVFFLVQLVASSKTSAPSLSGCLNTTKDFDLRIVSSSDEARKIFVILNFSSHADPFIARCLLSQWGKTGETHLTKESALVFLYREDTIKNKVQIFIYKKHIYTCTGRTPVSRLGTGFHSVTTWSPRCKRFLVCFELIFQSLRCAR